MPKVKRRSHRATNRIQRNYVRNRRNNAQEQTENLFNLFPFDFSKSQIKCGNKFDNEMKTIVNVASQICLLNMEGALIATKQLINKSFRSKILWILAPYR